jgi:hypothetical protein
VTIECRASISTSKVLKFHDLSSDVITVKQLILKKIRAVGDQEFDRKTQILRQIKICDPTKLGTADPFPKLERPHRLWLTCSKLVAIRVFSISRRKSNKN